MPFTMFPVFVSPGTHHCWVDNLRCESELPVHSGLRTLTRVARVEGEAANHYTNGTGLHILSYIYNIYIMDLKPGRKEMANEELSRI